MLWMSTTPLRHRLLISCREALFAEGGGQPRDYGTLTVRGETREVRELVKHKGDVRMRVEPFEALTKGDPIECEVDFARRYRIMRLHTAQHALAGAFRRLHPDYQSGGMRIDEGAESCEMRFSCGSHLRDGDLANVLDVVRAAAERGCAVRAEIYESGEEVTQRYGELYRLSDPSVKLKGRVRVIVIEGLDVNACGGTHLRDLNEAGVISVSALTHSNGAWSLSFGVSDDS